MSEQTEQLPPQAQALQDYQQGGGLEDCPKHYNDVQRFHYNWQMHKLQLDELQRMREAV